MKLARKNLCPELTRAERDPDGKTFLIEVPCLQLDCAYFMSFSGEEPNEGTRLDQEWGCAKVWAAMTPIRAAQAAEEGLAGVQAATESMRNEMVKRQDEANATVREMADMQKVEFIMRRHRLPASGGPVRELTGGEETARARQRFIIDRSAEEAE